MLGAVVDGSRGGGAAVEGVVVAVWGVVVHVVVAVGEHRPDEVFEDVAVRKDCVVFLERR